MELHLFCTLLTYVVKMSFFYKYVMHLDVKDKTSCVPVTVWLL